MADYNRGKKIFITEFVRKIFDEYEYAYLFDETKEEYTENMLNQYLEVLISYDGIADVVYNDLISRKEKRKIDISDLAEKIYVENEQLFNKPLEELKEAAVNEFFNAKISMTEIEKIMRERVAKLKEAMDKQEEITEVKKEYETEPLAESVPVENNEVSLMISEAEKQTEEVAELQEEITAGIEVEKPKQFVKTDNTGNNESGSVSLFGIGIAVLSIIAFILVAMILNLLLK